MRPGRLPADLHRAGFVPNHRRFSLSFAVCLILGPAIFLAILAYEGSLADSPAPFDDDPSHHHRDLTQNGPLRFCTYLDEKGHIQAKAGPCNDNSAQDIYRQHKITIPRDFCIEKMSNKNFDIVNCSDSTTSQIGSRKLPTSVGLCLHRNLSEMWEPRSCDGHEDIRYLERSHISSNKPCYTAHTGGWWEPCPKPEDTIQPRDDPSSTDDWCLHIGPDGSSTVVKNSTCEAAQSGNGPPAKCPKCENVSSGGNIEQLECYIRVGHEDMEVVRCAEAIKQPRDDPSNANTPWNQNSTCVVIHLDGTPAIVDCDKPGPIHVERRNIPPAPKGLCLEVGPDQETKAVECLEDSESDALLPHELEPLPPHLLDRATPPADNDPHTLADEPEKWTSRNRCTKDFCEWVHIPGEIKHRCYAKDDKNLNTAPMPDEALKYTAPFECNLCLELGVYHEDIKHIKRHCRNVIEHEDLVFKILVGALGGIVLVSVICGICFEHRRKKHPLKKPDAKLLASDPRFGRRSGRCHVVQPYDGTSELDLSLLSITASQKDAPEINVVSPSQSVILERGLKIPVMPHARSLRSRTGSINHVKSSPRAPTPTVDTRLSHSARVVEAAERTKFSSESLPSGGIQPVCRRKRSFCSSIMSESKVGSHKCKRIKCKICTERVIGSQSTDHAAVCHVTTPPQSPKSNGETRGIAGLLPTIGPLEITV